MSIRCQFLDPNLITYHPNIGIHVIVVFDSCMTTLDSARIVALNVEQWYYYRLNDFKDSH